MSKLSEAFSRFGTMVNISVGLTAAGVADAETAVVEFSAPDEAAAAFASTDAILGNRRIDVRAVARVSRWSGRERPWENVSDMGWVLVTERRTRGRTPS